MAKVIITSEFNVPDGENCNNCGYRRNGMIWCDLFHDYVYETEDYKNYVKCKSCPK